MVFKKRFRDPIRVPKIRENYVHVTEWKIHINILNYSNIFRVPTGSYRAPNIFLKKTSTESHQKYFKMELPASLLGAQHESDSVEKTGKFACCAVGRGSSQDSFAFI